MSQEKRIQIVYRYFIAVKNENFIQRVKEDLIVDFLVQEVNNYYIHTFIPYPILFYDTYQVKTINQLPNHYNENDYYNCRDDKKIEKGIIELMIYVSVKVYDLYQVSQKILHFYEDM